MNLKEKKSYVLKQFRRCLAWTAVAAALALAYVVFSLAAWVFGNPDHVYGDLFKFCGLLIPFCLFFVLFLMLTRHLVLSALSRSPE